MAPKINCFYVHLSTAIPAGQHFGFGGRLSRRTDLRLLTFSYCYFSLFFLIYYFYFSIFICYYYYYFFVDCSVLFVLFIISTSTEVSTGVCSSVERLAELDDKFVVCSVPTPPHLQALRIFVLFVVPCPCFFNFPCF